MDLIDGLDFARQHQRGVLSTIRNDTRPQLSVVMYRLGDDGLIRISITATRAKYFNLLRRPWAALQISSADMWQYVVLEADATLSEIAADPHDAAVEELVEYYRAAVGEHPDWDDYRAAMVTEQRLVVRLKPTRAYGMLRLR